MRVLDLFAGGVGGWSHGMHRAGYQTVAACEIDPWRRAVFAAQFPGTVMYADVRELTATRLLADIGCLPDIIVGSPPCQEISAANSKGEGITDDHLFWEWARLVFEVRPLWCAAENSPRSRTEGLDGILDALGAANYAHWPLVVGADNAGANHRRKRLWLVAADADGWLASGTRRHADGCVELGTRSDEDHSHPDRQGQHGLASNGEVGRSLDELVVDSPRLRRDGGRSAEASGWPRPEPAGDALGHAADADGTRHAIGSGERGDACPELPSALRDIGLAWPDWNGGIAGLTAACAAAGAGVVDDGSINGLPPGLRNRAIAALGDAVVAKIPEAIGRAMKVLVP